jgi:hypothetical protein
MYGFGAWILLIAALKKALPKSSLAELSRVGKCQSWLKRSCRAEKAFKLKTCRRT